MVSTDFTARAGGKKYTNSTFFKSMTPEYVAEQIWKQIQQQKSLQIIDWRYRLSNYLASLLPKRWVAQSVGAKIAQRIEPRQIKTLHL
jgi:short-subunit dehydrogenase